MYSEDEIKGARSELEQRRRKFWNEKVEQLCTDSSTTSLDKTTIYGMVDVSWTLRKSSMLETEACKILHEEEVLFQREECAVSGKRKLGSQKKDTINKNIDRMSVAHIQVESLDAGLKDARNRFRLADTIQERKRLKREFQEKSTLLTGSYSELKRAQDALSKSLSQKKREIENVLANKTSQDEEEELTSAQVS